MTITYQSVERWAGTYMDGIRIGCHGGYIQEGIQPTYGMTADDMGFHTFIMTVKLG